MAVLTPLLTVMEKAARKAARGLIRDFGEVENLQVSRKGPADFVSAADLKAEQVLIEELKIARPKFGILSEETGEIKGEDERFRWIVDPLDGTTNFLHGLPFFCTVIALEETKQGSSEIIAAYIEAPILKESFWAEKGQGAFMNIQGRESRMRVANRRNTEDALLSTGSSLKGQESHLSLVNLFAGKTAGVRSIGSSSLDLAYTAAGKYDGFFHDGLKIWDMAAGMLLIKEAGGFVTDIHNKYAMLETSSILAANEALHFKLAKIITGKL